MKGSSVVWCWFLLLAAASSVSVHAGFAFGNLVQQYLNGIGRVKNAASNGFSHAFNENGTSYAVCKCLRLTFRPACVRMCVETVRMYCDCVYQPVVSNANSTCFLIVCVCGRVHLVRDPRLPAQLRQAFDPHTRDRHHAQFGWPKHRHGVGAAHGVVIRRRRKIRQQKVCMKVVVAIQSIHHIRPVWLIHTFHRIRAGALRRYDRNIER